MTVLVPTTHAKYDGHKHHFMSQITAVINKFFCSESKFEFLSLILIFILGFM